MGSSLAKKRILVGVTGSIAAYKAILLVRRLKELGADVTVVMTQAAKEFISPLTFQVLSQRQVYDEIFCPTEGMIHLRLGEEADAILIAPATAQTLSKLAHGNADDLLSCIILAVHKPILVAPAMDGGMWDHPATQDNVRILKERGIQFVGPEEGTLASGRVGMGRFSEVDRIIHGLQALLNRKGFLKEEEILITAGPTQEDIDPVRFISNKSSGKMGYALAQVSLEWGAKVHLISGPTHLTPPPGVIFQKVQNAEEMRQAVNKAFVDSTIVIMSAAVSDFRPKKYVPLKIKKGEGKLHIELEETPDILYEIGKRKKNRFLVGFSAETGKQLDAVQEKLKRKNLDLIIFNNVSLEGAGFGEDTNIVTIVDRNGTVQSFPKMSKYQVAQKILSNVIELKGKTPRPPKQRNG